MLENVISTVVEALTEAGVPAGAAYPKTDAACPAGGMARVGVAKAVDRSSGFGRYLGIETDPERGEREVYGLRCEIDLSLDVYAAPRETNAALCCAALFDRAAAVIDGIGGLGVREISCGAAGPDAATGLFRLGGSVKCSALLTAAADESGETAAFTDFILRGELRTA